VALVRRCSNLVHVFTFIFGTNIVYRPAGCIQPQAVYARIIFVTAHMCKIPTCLHKPIPPVECILCKNSVAVKKGKAKNTQATVYKACNQKVWYQNLAKKDLW